MSKRRDEDDGDFGFRTPTKKSTKRRSRDKDRERPKKRKTGEHERPKKRKTGEHERPKKRETSKRKRSDKKKTSEHERPKKRKTGEHERPKRRKTGEHKRPEKDSKKKTGQHERPEKGADKKKTGKHDRPEKGAAKKKTGEVPAVSESSGGSSNKALVAAGGLGLVVIGGLAVMLLMAEPPPKKPKLKVAQIVPAQPQPTQARVAPVTVPQPVAQQPQPVAQQPKPVVQQPKATPKPSRPAYRPGKTLEELAKKSATHAAVARLLEDHMAIFDPAALRAPGPNRQPFHERRRREQELLEQLRGMGPLAVDAIKEMLIELRNRHQQIFLGKALAGIDGPEAAEAVVEVLGTVKDMSIQLSVTRSLPESPDSAGLLSKAFGSEEDPNLRSMLMREYNRRLATDDPGELFRDAAKDPDDRVRAEAVSILGRRRRPEDAVLLEEIIRDEQNVNIRKRAIVSYAQTGGQTSLGYLDSLVRDTGSAVDVRASAVLGISLVGGQEAISILDQVATSDPDSNIKTRANRAANNLRRNMERAKTQEEVEPPPVRIGPQAEPLERR
jgi:HEAT repeat protein